MRPIAPSVYGGVLDDLRFVVVDELKVERGDISEKSYSAHQRLSDAAPGHPACPTGIAGGSIAFSARRVHGLRGSIMNTHRDSLNL